MINRILNTGIVTLAAAICLLPASGFASTMFTMSGATGSTISGSGSTETVTIDWNELSVGSTNYITDNYVETYVNTGTLTIKEGGSTILSITEAQNLAGTFNGSSVPLYSAPTALTISGALLTELGFATSPPVSALTAGSYSVTAPACVDSPCNNTATSETSAFTLTTPEPSTFAMFGIALLSVIGYTARKRSVRS
jgi:PEP-CTERM motif